MQINRLACNSALTYKPVWESAERLGSSAKAQVFVGTMNHEPNDEAKMFFHTLIRYRNADGKIAHHGGLKQAHGVHASSTGQARDLAVANAPDFVVKNLLSVEVCALERNTYGVETVAVSDRWSTGSRPGELILEKRHGQ